MSLCYKEVCLSLIEERASILEYLSHCNFFIDCKPTCTAAYIFLLGLLAHSMHQQFKLFSKNKVDIVILKHHFVTLEHNIWSMISCYGTEKSFSNPNAACFDVYSSITHFARIPHINNSHHNLNI